MSPTPCNRADALGRLTKGEQFYGAAEDIRTLASEESEIGDAYVTLCVHAGIAAADAICCIELGEHSQGQNHHEAVQLIKKVSRDGKLLFELPRNAPRVQDARWLQRPAARERGHEEEVTKRRSTAADRSPRSRVAPSAR